MSDNETGAPPTTADLLMPQAVLSRAAQNLATRYDGVFSPQTVERYVFESYASLRRTARIHNHLTALATRFAADRLTALAQSQGAAPKDVPEVLLLNHHGQGRVHVRSAGSAPAEEINAQVVAAMAEIGVDLGEEYPKPLTDDVVAADDVVVSMGCGDACAVYPGKRYLDWAIDDPAGQPMQAVRAIRDDLDTRVRGLLTELTAPSISA